MHNPAAREGCSSLRVRDLFAEAISVIAQRPVRTLLTALGTILGVGAFVTTIGLAETTRSQVSSRFDALRATEVDIQDAAPDGTNPFPDDVDARLERLAGVVHAGLSFRVDGSATEVGASATPAHGTAPSIPVIAATPGAVLASRPTLVTGRVYDRWHEERGERVALLGRAAADQLGVTYIDQHPVIFINSTPYSVMGILEDVKRTPDLLLSVVIPTSAADTQFETRSAERHVVIDTAPGAAQLIGTQAPLALRPQQPERLEAIVPPDPKTLRNQVEGDVQILFYSLSGLALVIGAVAITNASLLNVTERRPEIGLRRALGATRAHILGQITLESALTGTLAGALGAALGLSAVTAVAVARTWTPTMQPVVLLAAPIIGIVTGGCAGIAPAVKAARTPPATTLRG